MVRNFPDGDAAGVPDPAPGDAADGGQDHTGGNVFFPAEVFDGAHQVRPPAQPEAVEGHRSRGADDGQQVHANSPSILYNFHYTTDKTILSTVSKFVDFFVFWLKTEKLLAF